MRKILLPLFVALCVMLTWVFAYTPSAELQEKISSVATRFEQIISEHGEVYRDQILARIEYYREVYSGDEKREYILSELESKIAQSVVISESDYLGSYSIKDDYYGTDMSVTISDDTRIMQVNALPNHETWTFPNAGNPNTISAQSVSYEFPLTGTYTGNETWAQVPWVAINGVKLEPETAERVECSTGEQYKIEAIQDFANLGLDFNHAHVQPTGEYHYHGSFASIADMFPWEDLVHVWFAQDGFLIYYSKKGSYSPSYELSDTPRKGSSCSYRNASVTVENTLPDGTYVSDWKYVQGLGDLDACNGTYIDGEYAYVITDEYPYIGRCLNGEYTQQRPGGWNMWPPPSWGWARWFWPPPRR